MRSLFGDMAVVIFSTNTEDHRFTLLIVVLGTVLISHWAHRFTIEKLTMGYWYANDILFNRFLKFLYFDIMGVFFHNLESFITHLLFKRLFFLENSSF